MLMSEMSGEECRDLLARLEFGRLACAHGNQPYIVPIYFAYEPGHLYGFATSGRKVEWMRSNPLVCVEVDEVLSHYRWSSVVVLGRYEELADTPEYSGVRLQAQLRLEKRVLWWQIAYAAGQVRGEPQPPDAVFYCIHIEEITGRRATADPVESGVGLARALAAFEEATTCHANRCFIAAAVMVRKTLEELCLDRQATGNSLKERIRSLGTKVALPQGLLDGLDDLRLLGNDAAYIESQEFNKVGQQEVEMGIEFAKEVLSAVYQYSVLLTRLRAVQNPPGNPKGK